EADAGSVDEIAHRARDEHLARPRQRGDSGADVDGDAREIVAAQLAFATVDPGPDLEPEVAGTGCDRPGAVDRPPRAVEGGEEPVARGLHLVPAVAVELTPDRGVMAVEEVVPSPVALG